MKHLVVRELSFNYGLQKILDKISFELPARQTLAIVGPSGCGKSTLLHLLAGLLSYDDDEIKQPFEPLAVSFISLHSHLLMQCVTITGFIKPLLNFCNIKKYSKVFSTRHTHEPLYRQLNADFSVASVYLWIQAFFYLDIADCFNFSSIMVMDLRSNTNLSPNPYDRGLDLVAWARNAYGGGCCYRRFFAQCYSRVYSYGSFNG